MRTTDVESIATAVVAKTIMTIAKNENLRISYNIDKTLSLAYAIPHPNGEDKHTIKEYQVPSSQQQ